METTSSTFMFILILFSIIDLGVPDIKTREAYLDNFCKEQIGDRYEAYETPKNEDEHGKPLKVFVKFKVIDIDEIDGAHMDFRLHMYFKLIWKDPRLKRPNHFDYDCSAYVWTPDVLFETAKSIQTFDNGHTEFRIEANGLVIMTDRYSFKAKCTMNFRNYPFDAQECIFSVGFTTTTDNMALLKWMDDESSPFQGKAVELARTIEPLQYHILKPTTNFTTRQTSNANFTHLYANFQLCRRLTGSIIKYYMPSTLLVMISWVTFWLKEEASSERVTLIMTALLTICTQGDQYKSELPPVNYITALDIWYFVCIFMLFATLLEFAFSYNAYRKRKKSQVDIDLPEQSQCLKFLGRQDASTGTDNKETNSDEMPQVKLSPFNKFLSTNKNVKLDSISKVAFPTSFFIFSVTYWIYYLW